MRAGNVGHPVSSAKKGLGERDLRRFKQEFEVLKRLSFPYIVEVYQYDETRNEYKMEYCEDTLRDYIARRNNKLSFAAQEDCPPVPLRHQLYPS